MTGVILSGSPIIRPIFGWLHCGEHFAVKKTDLDVHPADFRLAPLQRVVVAPAFRRGEVTQPIVGWLHCGMFGGVVCTGWPSSRPAGPRLAPLRLLAAECPGGPARSHPADPSAGSIAAPPMPGTWEIRSRSPSWCSAGSIAARSPGHRASAGTGHPADLPNRRGKAARAAGTQTCGVSSRRLSRVVPSASARAASGSVMTVRWARCRVSITQARPGSALKPAASR